jgi:mannose-6-phosphate isomerase-like protein (cupin superfamily)
MGNLLGIVARDLKDSQSKKASRSHYVLTALVSKMRRGTEPPPHVHSQEDEFLYVLLGDVTFYADGQVFSAAAGECIFLPRGTPHPSLWHRRRSAQLCLSRRVAFSTQSTK